MIRMALGCDWSLFLFFVLLIFVDGYLFIKYTELRPIREEVNKRAAEFVGDTSVIPWHVAVIYSIVILAHDGKLDFLPPEAGIIVMIAWALVVLLMSLVVVRNAETILRRVEWAIRLNALGIALLIIATFRAVCKSMEVLHGVMLMVPVLLYFTIAMKSAKIITATLKESSESKEES
ncbi:Hypothetical protein TGAM_2103 [Thermococcus gammatolerans EJ3]|uniref:Uncharacterized protein n=2 Tax=Thermococcus TaxID=2263 RepID=C5A2I6_THEGJ|nr:Hypothetical protein TGAM_2103 [Thermococcus gammatolerans EJ3]